MNIKNKKAIARKTLIEMVVLILSAVIIIIILGKYSLLHGQVVTKETCRDSVLLRASIIEKGMLEKIVSVPPLNCKTRYYCITKGEKCEDEKYIPVTVKDENDIKEAIANYMYDCWDELGEGKRDFLYSGKRSLICSVIRFENKVKNDYPSVSGVYSYMASHNIPGGNLSFIKYLTGIDDLTGKVKIEGDKLTTNVDYAIVFTGFKGKGTLRTSTVLSSLALLGEGAVMFFFPPSIPFVAPVFYGTAAAGATWMTTDNVVEQIEASKSCEDNVCNMIHLIPYDKSIAKVVGNLEATP